MKRQNCDIAIIGSGAGGGTVAQELSPLCKDGARIVVLEKGPKLRDDEFTGQELEMARALYGEGGGFLTAEGTMTLAFGCAYGGSTVVYTGTSLLPPERVIRRWNVPGLSRDEIERRAAPTHRIREGSLEQVVVGRQQPLEHRGQVTSFLIREVTQTRGCPSRQDECLKGPHGPERHKD